VISKDDSLIKIHLNNFLFFRYNYQATYRSHLPTSAQTPSPPKLPPKISAQQSNYPVIPPKIPLSADVPKLPPKIKISSGPTVDGNQLCIVLKKDSLNVIYVASSERGEPLRQMVLPEFLQRKFLSIAEPNTRNKIETCGILAGKLVSKKK
jgi:STAM-binding protein